MSANSTSTTLTKPYTLDFEAPGPGSWQRDEDHWPRPVPASYAEIYPDATVPFVKEWTSRYGLLLDYFETAFVNGFGYARIHAVGEPEKGGSGPPPKPIFKALIALHPALRSRRRAARDALDGRLWLEDLELWENEAKPRIVAENRANASRDRAEMDDEELLDHVDACRETLRRFIGLHHRFNGSMVPVGLLMLKTREWLGDDDAAFLGLIEGASPVSSGRSPELRRLAEAIRASSGAADALDEDAVEALAVLQRAGGEVRGAFRDYVETVGYRLVGDSIEPGNPTLIEMPELMVRTIQRAVQGNHEAISSDELDEHLQSVRARVPGEDRDLFDRLVADTRKTYAMRDERSVYGDVWAAGIFRQALLELGRRLVERGDLEEPTHLVEATSDEVRALAEGSSGLVADLAERARFRATHADYEAPTFLGGEPGEPPPMEWLPGPMRQVNEAIFIQIAGFMGRGGHSPGEGRLTGTPASAGSYRGTAKVIVGPGEFGRIERGDVLVARTTSEAFNVVLPLLGAIVTDRGGPLSHAAIVSREARIPCVVGTGEATSFIPDGTEVTVDGLEGFVEIG